MKRLLMKSPKKNLYKGRSVSKDAWLGWSIIKPTIDLEDQEGMQ